MKHVKVYDTTWQKIINEAPTVKPVIKTDLATEPEPKESYAEPTKKCPRCGKVLPLSAFGLNKSKKDGHQDYCKICMREVVRESHARKMAKKEESAIEQSVSAEPEIVYVTTTSLEKFSNGDLLKELRDRGCQVLVDPTPRDMISRLKELGYEGTLVYYKKRTINLNTNF